MTLAAERKLPRLIEERDIKGDVHMHTTATDGRNTIREMAEAGIARGFEYIAITDHSKALAMTNGLDEKRALEHLQRIREVERELEGRIRIFTGIEVDILADGALDMDDEVLAQMDVVIASIHSRFDQSREETTARTLRAIENPQRADPGASDGAADPAPRAFCDRHGRGDAAGGRAGRGHGAQCRAGAAGSLRPRSAAGEGTGSEDRDQHGRARYPNRGQDGLRRAAVAAGVAGAEGCAEYAGGGGILARLRARNS